MEFKLMRDLMIKHFNEEMVNETDKLFEVELDKEELWNTYLDSFPKGTNEIYRERREFDCSCCHHFFRNMGNVVAIKENKIITIFDFECGIEKFDVVLKACSDYVKTKKVNNVFVTKEKRIGTPSNFEDFHEWSHFYLDIPRALINITTSSNEEIKGQYRDTRNVFKRSLEEITVEATETVLELISQNSLYRGEEWKTVLEQFLKYQKKYNDVPLDEKENWVWKVSTRVGNVIGRIRNHSMGTLLVDISNNVELDEAVKSYERIVAPSNYKRPKAIFTKKMLEEAQNKITEMGYLSALERRFATLDDIHINDILFSNKDSAKKMIGGSSVFDGMLKDVKATPKQFSKVEEITIDKFINNVLPTAKEIELYVENKHQSNLVSLIAPIHKDSNIMFKWNNNFSWAYAGNMTDSLIKERVKAAGGDVTGDLRFSIQWNDECYNPNDFDAHCVLPNGGEIYYASKHSSLTNGSLDVDIINPRQGVPAVENITWPSRNKMIDGEYTFLVHCFNNNGGRSGFKAEIEFDGQIYKFEYDKGLRHKESVIVASVILKNGKFTLQEKLSSSVSSKEIWGIKTNTFVPVSTVMYSPNYWQDNKVGNKHYFFMLKDCVNNEEPNPFFNEYLKEELMAHKRVFEALGSKCKVQSNENQLSGLGFSSTQRNEIVVKVKGTAERVLKIKF